MIDFLQGIGWAESFRASSHIFLRALGAIYLIAFVSLAVQIRGLLGANGILPARNFLEAIKGGYGRRAYRILPTVFWFSSTDRALLAACLIGASAAVSVLLGMATFIALIVCWILYLSLTVIGQDFLSFQWDVLLLEAGFIAIFLAPLPFHPEMAVSPLAFWMVWWLFFRLNFESGVVKWTSGDRTWRDFTALCCHYESQPLPTAVSWYAHHLPKSFHRFSCAAMFVIEVALPFFVFAPAPWRYIAVGGIFFLQFLILATGNYNFFNLLTVALGIPFFASAPPSAVTPVPPWWLAVIAVVFAAHAGVGLMQVIRLFRPVPVTALEHQLSRRYVVNSYGLFRVMTTERPEIIVEGSIDGEKWEPYEFRYKAGDVNTRPRLAEPHQPRLDWQMWFAALTSYPPAWFRNFLVRLLQGEPSVLKLLKSAPMEKPKYVRALLYDYRFGEKSWWRRELRGVYFPPIRLEKKGR